MKTRPALSIVPLICCGVVTAHVARYVDEYPLTVGISPAADDLRAELQDEIGKMLAAGRLAPLRIHYADAIYEGYFVYTETLRDLITIGAAYPYLTPVQQTAARAFVRTQCMYAIWWKMLEDPPTNGKRRELYETRDPMHGWAHRYGMDVQTRPRVAGLIGLELYARRANDWALISNYWDNIKDFFSRPEMYGGWSGYHGDLYGTLGAPLAMARMARVMGDDPAFRDATNRLAQQLIQHLNFPAIMARSTNRYYEFFSSARAANLVYQGWLFLNITPEICRFIDDHVNVRSAALAHVDAGKRQYPLWWLHQAPYWTRWTGDEGMGLSPEIIGMIFPLERWVRRTPASQLRRWLSAPVGRGDCYYIEALINALEAHGTTVWTRYPHVPCALLTPNGGEFFSPGTFATITWAVTSSATHVNLFYSKDDFATSTVIATNVPNTGGFLWDVPNDFTTNARIKLIAAIPAAWADESDEPFSIVPEPGMLLYSVMMLVWSRHRCVRV